jgi:hypothetical protein
VATHQQFLCHSLALAEDLSGCPALGPAAGVGQLGVVVAQVALRVELEAGLLGSRPKNARCEVAFALDRRDRSPPGQVVFDVLRTPRGPSRLTWPPTTSETAVEEPVTRPLAVAFDELALVI